MRPSRSHCSDASGEAIIPATRTISIVIGLSLPVYRRGSHHLHESSSCRTFLPQVTERALFAPGYPIRSPNGHGNSTPACNPHSGIGLLHKDSSNQQRFPNLGPNLSSQKTPSAHFLNFPCNTRLTSVLDPLRPYIYIVLPELGCRSQGPCECNLCYTFLRLHNSTVSLLPPGLSTPGLSSLSPVFSFDRPGNSRLFRSCLSLWIYCGEINPVSSLPPTTS